MPDIDELRHLELLTGLDDATLGRLASIATTHSLAEGEYLFLLGGHADRLYAVREGEVVLCFPLPVAGTVQDVTVETVLPGGSVGWSALVKPYRFTLSARASRPSRLVGFGRQTLLSVLEQAPQSGYLFMRQLAEVIGVRLHRTQALFARELQRAVEGATPFASKGSKDGTER